MARLGSQAVAGYYPMPSHLVEMCASYFEKVTYPLTIVDPCAADGAALEGMCSLSPRSTPYGCELEKSRYCELLERFSFKWNYRSSELFLLGDSLSLTYTEGHVDVLYLNPPYDSDMRHKRLEERFLSRYAPSLCEGGWLVFVVPYYALAASAETLGTHFTNLQSFKFPSPDFEVFKQVVLFAQKSAPLLTPDPRVVAQVTAWSQAYDSMPTLSLQEVPKFNFHVSEMKRQDYYRSAFYWRKTLFDLTLLKSTVRPWEHRTPKSVGPVKGILPQVPVVDLLLRKYPVVTTPRPAHIASGIASGIFNGALLEAPDMPSLLVKGVFDREFKTIDEREDKDGNVTLTQVEAPKLVVTALDLESKTYHTLKTDKTNSKVPSEMGVGDLLEHYGPAMTKVMAEMCPVLFDPKTDQTTLGQTKRTLYRAQSDTVKALTKLIHLRGCGILLGEIGVGKTTVALALAATLNRNRVLVLCPPQLLDMWKEEVTATLPSHTPVIIDSVEDLSNLPEKCIAILSREKAKLSHGVVGMAPGSQCPKCGAAVPPGDHAKKHSRCDSQKVRHKSALGPLAIAIARRLAPYAPDHSIIRDLLREPNWKKVLAKPAKPFLGLPKEDINSWLASALKEDPTDTLATILACAIDRDVPRILNLLEQGGSRSSELVYLLPQEYHEEALSKMDPSLAVHPQRVLKSTSEWKYALLGQEFKYEGGAIILRNSGELTPLGAALRFLAHIASLVSFSLGEPCGEPLYSASPDPRRYALSRFITRFHKSTFDFMVLDEAHEASSENSAQTRSAHRLMNLRLPFLMMTGSIMNGYAESLFMPMWAASTEFREEFRRDEKAKFVERYGYRKKLVSDKPIVDDRKVVEYGAHSDRVSTSERIIGNAEGILPLFILRYLLSVSVTLHKSDLDFDLPPFHEEKVQVHAAGTLQSNYEFLKTKLVTQISKDRFVEGKAGKLWGQLAELPSYLDRAVMGNAPGEYRICYPDGEVVAAVPTLPYSTILPKEEWLIATVKAELAEGRNCMVLGWHKELLPRLQSLLESALGEKVAILQSEKVGTKKRQEWISTHVVSKGVRVLVSNPVTIQTGLNNLTHFATEIWMENCACNPLTLRQTNGRVFRIGQDKPTRSLFAVYGNTLQDNLYDLLMRKVAVSISTDGLDPESAMFAAGLGNDTYLTGLSLGKQIWNLLQAE